MGRSCCGAAATGDTVVSPFFLARVVCAWCDVQRVSAALGLCGGVLWTGLVVGESAQGRCFRAVTQVIRVCHTSVPTSVESIAQFETARAVRSTTHQGSLCIERVSRVAPHTAAPGASAYAA